MTLFADLARLERDAMVVMFEIDTTAAGGGIFRFHPGVNKVMAPVVWRGESYAPFAIEAEGFARSAKGQMARPVLRVGAVDPFFLALSNDTDNLRGAKVTRRRTLAKYLDAVNFPNSVNPDADPNAAFADDVYFVRRRSRSDGITVEYELAAAIDLVGVEIPLRLIVASACGWTYQGEGCGYAGLAMFREDDMPTLVPSEDVCSHTLTGCRARYGASSELSFGGFPAAGAARI